MSIRAVLKTLLTFVLGALLGVLGAVTLRHEIWPLAGRVGILLSYAAVSIIVFLVLLFWYLGTLRYMRQRLDEPLLSVLSKLFNFFIAVVFFLIAIGGGLIFVALG